MRLTGLEPTRRIDTSTSSWPVYQFQHSRKQIPSKKDCLIIIAIRIHNVNQNLRFFKKNFPGGKAARKTGPQSWDKTSPMGSVMTSPAAKSRATGDLLMRASRSPRK